MTDWSGTSIRGYELRERIGAGGFGAVYRAFQPALNREVAVKVILPERASQPEFIRRFEAEARTVAQLDHLHIVPLFDFWREEDGTAFLVMRWLRGGSLRALLRVKPLKLGYAVKIIEQVCDALAFAHVRGIVHRDVKPDNILLDEQGNAYLSDFGIAKDLFSEASLTSSSSTPGTPAYAAPEQVGGVGITALTDQYAVGIMLFECLEGTHPFPETPLQHLYENLPKLAHTHEDIPPEVDEVIHRATQKRAGQRYQTISEFSQALRDAAHVYVSTGEYRAAIIEHAGSVSPDDAEKTLTDGRVAFAAPYTSAPSFAARRDSPPEASALLIQSAMDVPSRPEVFIGREDLLAEINTLLDRGTRVLLQGLGGMGKTSLAAETAARRAEAGNTPILWLRAVGDRGENWLRALAHPLEAHEKIAHAPPDTRQAAFRAALIDSGVRLIILDDVWDGEALKMVIDALPPGFPALITSRQRFPVGKILDVSELPRSQALELLNYHASEAFTLADEDAVELCSRLGDHPFTIEIAAKTLQVDLITPAELLERIRNSPHLLEMPEGYATPGRSSVKALLSDSVSALDEQARRVFMAFGALFVPRVTPELLATALEVDPQTLEPSLTTLLRRGLIRREKLGDTTFFTLHSLAYSYTIADPSIGRRDVIRAVRSYASRHKDDFNAIDLERGNLLKAAEAAAASHDGNSTIAIMRALTIDGGYFNARGHDGLLLSCLDQAIVEARAAGEAQAETLHYFLSRRGNAFYSAAVPARALADYRAALDLADNLNLPARQVILHCVISKIHSDQAEFDQAEAHLSTATLLAHASGDDLLLARVLEQRGYHYAEKHDFEAAKQTYMEQVALAEKLKHSERLFFALCNLAAAETELAAHEQAIIHVGEAMEIARSEDNRVWLGYAQHVAGTVHHNKGDRQRAASVFSEALETFRSIGNLRGAAELEDYMKTHGYSA